MLVLRRFPYQSTKHLYRSARLLSTDDPNRLFREQIEELKAEREDLFGFTEQDRDNWTKPSTLSENLMQEIEEARTMQALTEKEETIEHKASSPPPILSHVSEDSSQVHMVDVGNKKVTRRVAVAQSQVLLPPEVLAAFSSIGATELTSPKGPIFTTAKLAGIIAAKRTSELIPLCHPLPLDQVEVDIELKASLVTIRCTCRVTHKTGVEMEALTGASVAALTIYDMVKAASHEVKILDTQLLQKEGGRRKVG